MEQQEMVKGRTWLWFLLFPAIILVWWLFELWVVQRWPTWVLRGQFGDSFGAINALFSGLAFAGVIIALVFQRRELVLQRTELRLQREELKLTRIELKRTAEAQEQSFAALNTQAEIQRETAILDSLAAVVAYYDREKERWKNHSTKSIELDMDQKSYLDEFQKRLKDMKRFTIT